MPHGPEAGKSSNAGRGLVDQNTSLENEPIAVDNTHKSTFEAATNPAEENSLGDEETEDEKIAPILDLNCVRHSPWAKGEEVSGYQ
jgi:hypothetical protein